MAEFERIRDRKLASIARVVPQEWQIPPLALPAPSIADISTIPRSTTVLTTREKEITSHPTAQSLLSALQAKHYTAVEVCTAFCKRAAIVHQLTNCLTEYLFDSALARARFLDDHLARTGQLFGPLHGLPISVKDMFDVKGVDSSIGIASLCFRPATANATTVDILLNAGAVIHVKTNVPQTMLALDSVNNVFGRTLNPFNRQQWTAGGSSGGEGVLVAMRGSVFGLGTDVGGSIRIPAMCNGIVGFKPSTGRVPTEGMETGTPAGSKAVGMEASVGVIARSLEDVGLFMATIEQGRAYELESAIIPGPWWTSPFDTSLSGSKLRIGILPHDSLVNPLPPIRRVLEEVVQKLQTAGIETIILPAAASKTLGRCSKITNKFFAAPGNSHMFSLLESTGEPLIPWLAPRLRKRSPMSLEQFRDIFAQKQRLQDEFLNIWREAHIDAIICPVAPHPVPPPDRWGEVGYTAPWVTLDYPAASLPVRNMVERDIEEEMVGEIWGRADGVNRRLWNKETIDRKKYLNSPLSVQVITPRLQERKLWDVMKVIKQTLDTTEIKKPLTKL